MLTSTQQPIKSLNVDMLIFCWLARVQNLGIILCGQLHSCTELFSTQLNAVKKLHNIECRTTLDFVLHAAEHIQIHNSIACSHAPMDLVFCNRVHG